MEVRVENDRKKKINAYFVLKSEIYLVIHPISGAMQSWKVTLADGIHLVEFDQ